MAYHEIEGQLVLRDARIALLVSRFNSFVVESLLEGAVDTLKRHGAEEPTCTSCAYPAPTRCRLLHNGWPRASAYEAIVALGAVIRGGTPHFEYVAGECTKGLSQVSLQHDIPIAFGVLTVDSIEQAIERAGTKAGNKGAEAAMSTIEMINLLREIEAERRSVSFQHTSAPVHDVMPCRHCTSGICQALIFRDRRQFLEDEDFSRADQNYFIELLSEAPKQIDIIDENISEYIDRPLEQLDPVERAVLRLATYELLYRLDIPYRVTINEAVQLTKKFGAEQGHAFVNAVLDKAARKLRAAECEKGG